MNRACRESLDVHIQATDSEAEAFSKNFVLNAYLEVLYSMAVDRKRFLYWLVWSVYERC